MDGLTLLTKSVTILAPNYFLLLIRNELMNDGHAKLWNWFGIDRPSFCVMPRVLMHSMPDEWQSRITDLLKEMDEAFPNLELQTRVTRIEDGKLARWPAWFLNYRYPDATEIEKARK